MSGRDHRDPGVHRDPVDEQELIEDELQPVYARALRLRYVRPSGLTCLAFFEGSFVLGGLLALAELIPWWGVLVLPVAVAVMVKINDLVAGAVERSAELVPEREREMFRREMVPAVGRQPWPVPEGRPGAAVLVGDQGSGATGPGATGPGIRIRRIGSAHTEATAATAAVTTATTATTATAATCAALAAPTVLLETVPAGPATAAALAAPTVLLDVLQAGQLSEHRPPAPG